MDELTPLRKAARAAKTRRLSVSTYKKHSSPGDPDPSTFIRHYGSWPAACNAAGLEAGSPTVRRYSDDEILAALRACHTALQGPISAGLYRKWREGHPDQPPAQIVATRLERLAGDVGIPVTKARARAQRFTDEQLLDAVRAAAKAVSPSGYQGLSILDYGAWRDAQPDRKQLPAPDSIADRFGTWPKARTAAFGDRDELQSLRAAFADDPNLSFRSYDRWAKERPGAPSAFWFTTRFGSWSKALNAAGILAAR